MSDNEKVVYLSGRIDDLTREEAARDRKIVTAIFEKEGWTVLDPMRGEADHFRAGTVITDIARKRQGLSDAALVQRDLQDLRRSRVVLILTASTPTIGTVMEWGISAHDYEKVIVAVDRDGTARKHPWARHYTSNFFDTPEQAAHFIVQFLGA